MTTAGVGIDLVEIARFEAVLARRPGLAARLFTAAEIADCAGRASSLAARFAAKEATWKALGVGLGGVDFHDVSVARSVSGAPTLEVRGRAAAAAAAAAISDWHVSLTHTGDLAAAMVVGNS